MDLVQEDIEILEEYIENFYNCGIEIVKKPEIIKLIDYKEIHAMENVLARLKILKNKEKKLIEVTNLYLNSVPKSKIIEIRDKAECMDYYCLNDVIDDLNKLLGDE